MVEKNVGCDHITCRCGMYVDHSVFVGALLTFDPKQAFLLSMWARYYGESRTTSLSSATIASCGHSGLDQLGSYSSMRSHTSLDWPDGREVGRPRGSG